jgi:ABC-2 type transport system ATP-binding protein
VAEVDQQQNINDLFTQLSAKSITVKSMRNKSNRLEELFVSLINANAA